MRAEYEELSQQLRAYVATIPESLFDAHDDVLALKRRRADNAATHQANVAALLLVRDRIAAIRAKRDAAETELARIRVERPALLAKALLAGDDLSADIEMQSKAQALAALIEQVRLAEPGLDAALHEAQKPASRTGANEGELDVNLRDLLIRLRIEHGKATYLR